MRGIVMVRYSLRAKTNTQYENPKVNYDEYIETSFEPFDSEITAGVAEEIDVEMAETIYDMRREFKRQNKKLRKLYSSKEPNRSSYKDRKTTRVQHISKRRAVA